MTPEYITSRDNLVYHIYYRATLSAIDAAFESGLAIEEVYSHPYIYAMRELTVRCGATLKDFGEAYNISGGER